MSLEKVLIAIQYLILSKSAKYSRGISTIRMTVF